MAGNDTSRSGLSDRVRSLRLSGRDAATGSRTRWLPWIISFVLLLTTTAFGYRAYRVGALPRTDAAGDPPPSKVEKAPPPVSGGSGGTAGSVAATGEVVLQSKGYVIPISLVQVSPKVGGQLVWINPRFEEGNIFKEGDILARIEQKEFESDYRQAQFALEAASRRLEEVRSTLPEEVKQAEAELEETRATASQQKLELERNRRLTSSSAVAQREFEQAKYAYDGTLSRVKRLEATVRLIKEGRLDQRIRAAEAEKSQAEWLLEKAKWRYDNTEVRAPVTGTILTKKAELGNIVNPSAFSSGISASLCEMADLTRLEIDLSIQERDIATVKVGQQCLIMPEAYVNDKEFLARHPQGYRGEVSRLMPTADRAKGAVPVRVRIRAGEITQEEAGKYLRPELSATVSFLRGEMKSPAAADARTTTQK